ncbi:MAG TPA: hypothetical protein VHS59_01365, partial [Bacillota bacterium]|nr:hypothetical protein [Bacillota bacterium]
GGNKDAWFVGYTPELVATVWLGYDRTDRDHYLRGVVGGSFPTMLWRKVMEQALKGVPERPFPKYEGKLTYRRDVRTTLPPPTQVPDANLSGKNSGAQQENGGTVGKSTDEVEPGKGIPETDDSKDKHEGKPGAEPDENTLEESVTDPGDQAADQTLGEPPGHQKRPKGWGKGHSFRDTWD